ncbi:hypothetical protein MY8738_009966 [Beauveria namnaoensis]
MAISDFETALPDNFDDDQLVETEPVPRLANERTQMTMALALRATFSQRLAAVRVLNNVSRGISYEETLHMDAQLRGAYKVLSQRLQSSSGQGVKTSLATVDLRNLDTILYRYLSAIHTPFFTAALHNAKYMYSRAVVVDCALKVWNSIDTKTSMKIAQFTGKQPLSNDADHLRRLATCASGFYTVAAMHSSILLAMELRAELKENDGVGPKVLRPDLVTVLARSQDWFLEVIQAGQTNTKGYLLMRIIAAEVDSLCQNIPQEELVTKLLKTANDVSEECKMILSAMVDRLAVAENEDASQIH